MSKVQTHELVAGFQAGHEHSHVGLCTTVGLYVGILGAKELLDALLCQSLGLVYYLATAIVTVAGITLGILVCQAATHSLHNLITYEILTGNELNATLLTQVFTLDDAEQ